MPGNPRAFPPSSGKRRNPANAKKIDEINQVDVSWKAAKAKEKTIIDKSAEEKKAIEDAAKEVENLKKLRIEKQELDEAIKLLPDVRVELAKEQAKLASVKTDITAQTQMKDETGQIKKDNVNIKAENIELRRKKALLKYSIDGKIKPEEQDLLANEDKPEVLSTLVDARKKEVDIEVAEYKKAAILKVKESLKQAQNDVDELKEDEEIKKKAIEALTKSEKAAVNKTEETQKKLEKKQLELDAVDETIKKKFAIKEEELNTKEAQLNEGRDDMVFVIENANKTIDALNHLKPQLERLHKKRLNQIIIPNKIILEKDNKNAL